MNVVKSHFELSQIIEKQEKAFLLLYNSNSEQGKCAFQSINKAIDHESMSNVFVADLNEVRDIHTTYNIKSAPSLLYFEKGVFSNIFKGCHQSSYYKSLFNNAVYTVKNNQSGVKSKRVTVYSTPTCSWCNTLKTWLRKQGIAFIDIDISKNEQLAEELVRKSGQQGVPQTEINGEMVVGFNQNRLKELLEIQ